VKIIESEFERRKGSNKMKFKKSRFKIGSFSFGLGGGGSQSPQAVAPVEPPIDPFLQNLGLREESRLKSASLASLMRKTHYRQFEINPMMQT